MRLRASPVTQHPAVNIAAATEDNDDFVFRADRATKCLFKTPIVTKGNVDAAGELDHDALVVGEAPAAHCSFSIRKNDAADVAALGVFEGCVCDAGAAEAGGLGCDFGEGDDFFGLDGCVQTLGSGSLHGEDGGLGHVEGVHSLTDAVEKAATTDGADKDVGFLAAGHLGCNLGHAGAVALPDIWVVKGWAVDGFCLCLRDMLVQ